MLTQIEICHARRSRLSSMTKICFDLPSQRSRCWKVNLSRWRAEQALQLRLLWPHREPQRQPQRPQSPAMTKMMRTVMMMTRALTPSKHRMVYQYFVGMHACMPWQYHIWSQYAYIYHILHRIYKYYIDFVYAHGPVSMETTWPNMFAQMRYFLMTRSEWGWDDWWKWNKPESAMFLKKLPKTTSLVAKPGNG